MIVGIGTDLIHIDRIEKSFERFGERFLARFLSPGEREVFEKRGRPGSFLAKRFAAKEATAKALGVGIGARARWTEIEVLNNSDGAPRLRLFGAAAQTAKDLAVSSCHIALTDEVNLAQAFVILES
ncbi:MAG: holo-[acyl-carrier protein] synthase [Paracoccaceae bacterium]|jgi:holo-[acyl-carrier protein] synthase